MSSLLEADNASDTPPGAGARVAVQQTFDELGRPLRDTTFVVVDLETTGGSAAGGSSITEIGAVKVCGGEVLGEFQTLVRPSEPIPAFISVLTGITNAMVADAPRIESALPAFLEFARGGVLVAHNAPFDVGFLKHYADKQGLPWPRFEILDTAKLARRVVTRDDAPNCKLSSLARLFNASTTPNHRALSDARATVDVLHGMMERLGNLGVHTLEELSTFSSRVSTAQRKKRHLAEQLPHAPGVYLFRDSRNQVLYVGTSKDLRSRVRTYFTASETRSRMGEMVGLATSVEGITCATALEASVRELRLIAEHKPRYNRRSKFPERVNWVKLTVEPWPRLSLVKQVLDDGADYLGPFRSRSSAEAAMAALHESFPIRQCSGRLPRHPSRSACVLAEMGRCLSPCDGSANAGRLHRHGRRPSAQSRLLTRGGHGSDPSPDGCPECRRAVRGGHVAPQPDDELHPGGGTLAAAARPHPVRRDRGRAPQRPGSLGGPRRPARTPCRGRRDPLRGECSRLDRPAAAERRHRDPRPGAGACCHRRGVRAGAGVARAERGPPGRRRRRVVVSGRRSRVPTGPARRDRDVARVAGPLRHTPPHQHRRPARAMRPNAPLHPTFT